MKGYRRKPPLTPRRKRRPPLAARAQPAFDRKVAAGKSISQGQKQFADSKKRLEDLQKGYPLKEDRPNPRITKTPPWTTGPPVLPRGKKKRPPTERPPKKKFPKKIPKVKPATVAKPRTASKAPKRKKLAHTRKK